MTISKHTLIAIAITAIICLTLGFGAGWFGFRVYLASSMATAMEDMGSMAEPDAAPATGEEEEPEPAGPPSAESKTDGVFEYKVTADKRAGTYNDTECMENYKADGEFIILDISAKNVGSAPSSPAISMGEVTAYTAKGDAFSTMDDICAYTDEVNPGGSTSYKVVFEAPKGTEFAVLELTSMDATEAATIKATK